MTAIADWLGPDLSSDCRFGLYADNGMPWAETARALHAVRAVTVPLPRHFIASQLAHVIDDAGIDRVITDEPAALAQWPGAWRHEDTGPYGLQRWSRAVDGRTRRALPPGTCKITYTSGSTGQPKGVCLSAEAIDTVAASLAAVLRPLGVARHLCLLPLSTLLDELVSVHVAPLLGADVVLPSLRETGIGFGGLDLERLLGTLTRHAPDSLLLVPELLRVLVQAVARGWRAPASLKFIAVGGASVAPELLDAAHRAGLPVYEGYGLSECASVVALNSPGMERKGSVGRVLPHATVRIDAAGEIHVRGTRLLGYLGEDTAPGAEVATGDLGWMDEDGYLYVRGRRKNLLITSLGRNVSPEWVERELLARTPITQAVVIGEGRPYLSALLWPTRSTATAAELAAAVEAANAALPDYARVRRWALLPEPLSLHDGTLTANGRTRRDRVLDRYTHLIEGLHDEAIAS
jgi:long-subunit acyl-CoA synthetase (AMP-forming)